MRVAKPLEDKAPLKIIYWPQCYSALKMTTPLMNHLSVQ